MDIFENIDNFSPDIEPAENLEPPGQPDNYQFASGDISTFINDFSEEKEDMNVDELPTPEEFQEVETNSVSTQTSKLTAELITSGVDTAFSTGLAMLAKSDNTDLFRANRTAKKDMVRIITEYVKITGGEMPLWMQLLIVIVTAYGMQIPIALQMRKEKGGR